MDVDSDQSYSTSISDSSESATDNDEVSELDDEYVEQRQLCTQKMADLERQYSELYDLIIIERTKQISAKLDEIKRGEAIEYLQPLDELEQSMKIRAEVAGILHQYKLENLKILYEAEELTANQNFENEKSLLYDALVQNLENEIKRLEEDRNNVELNTNLWMVEQGLSDENKTVAKEMESNSMENTIHYLWDNSCHGKPTTVTGPFIVYMLKDSQILEDWMIIRRALSNSY